MFTLSRENITSCGKHILVKNTRLNLVVCLSKSGDFEIGHICDKGYLDSVRRFAIFKNAVKDMKRRERGE